MKLQSTCGEGCSYVIDSKVGRSFGEAQASVSVTGTFVWSKASEVGAVG